MDLSTFPVRRRALALAAAATLAVGAAGCSNGAVDSSSQSGASGGAASATPTPTGPSVATVDAGLVGSTTATLTAKAEGVSSSTPRFAQARNLTEAVEATRGRMLRGAWRADATDVAVTGSVIASSDAVVGVQVHSTATVAGSKQEQDATLWYSTAKKQTYGPDALVKAAQWPTFAQAVSKAVTDKGGDATKATTALKGMSSPWGSGPAIAFSGDGQLLVTFSSGVVATDPVTVTIPADQAKGYLGAFGTQALAAATSPKKFTGSTTATADPELAKGVVGSRPSTAVGPDCRVLHCVALTYDDGPSTMTPTLLASIKKSKAVATFFQMGNSVKENPKIALQVVASGMEVGSHSVTHPAMTTISETRKQEEVNGNSKILQGVSGLTPLLFRPPYGDHNSKVDAVIKDAGMSIIQWEVDSEDWKTHSVSQTIKTVEAAKAYTSTIVLEHDVQQDSIEAAPTIYAYMTKAGMTMVTVTELSLNSGGYEVGHAYCRGTSEKQEGFNCQG